jgi:hypothetical protein
MKKFLAILFAMMFMVATTGLCFAQAAPAKAPVAEGQAKPAEPIKGDKSDASKKAQAVTPEKKAAAGTPGVATGQAKPDTKPVKKSEKSKKRQAPTEDKKKAAEAPKTGEGMAAPPAAPAKK